MNSKHSWQRRLVMRSRRRRRRDAAALVAAVVVAAVFAIVAPTARSAFPGQNGKIAFGCGWEICVLNADGSGVTQLTNDAIDASTPAWSPDGRKIAYEGAGGPADATDEQRHERHLADLVAGRAEDRVCEG